jgi:HEAT repeat protein
MLALLVSALLFWPHGGQYLPPHPEPGEEDEDEEIVQPGFGPLYELDPERWEWWFDFNQERLFDRPGLIRSRADGSGQGRAFQEVTDEQRLKQVLPALKQGLKHHNRDVRASAAMTLARLGQAGAMKSLVPLTVDNDLYVRAQAVLALGVSRSPAAPEHLAELFKRSGQSVEMRIFAMVALAMGGVPEGLTMISEQLEEKTFGRHGNLLRAGLVYAAGTSRSPDLLPALESLGATWLVRNDAELRALTAVAMGRIGAQRSVNWVVGLLSAKENKLRRSAAAAIESLAPLLETEQAELVMARALREGDISARVNLLRACGRIRHPASRKFLHKRLKDSTALTRPHVALALGMDGHPDNVPLLIERLPEEHVLSTRSALATSLGLLADPRAVPLLEEELEDTREAQFAGYVCLALGLIGEASEEARDRILAVATENHDVEAVRLAVVALGMLGDRERLDTLAAEMENVTNTVDRAAQVYALGLVGDGVTLDFLLQVAKDERQPSYVIAYAMQALGDTCDPKGVSPLSWLSNWVDVTLDIPYLVELYRFP